MKIQNIETGNIFELSVKTDQEKKSAQKMINSGDFKILYLPDAEKSLIELPEIVMHQPLEERLIAKAKKELKKEEAKAGAK